MDFNNVSPAIVIVCYILVEILKLFIKSEKFYKLIPIICAVAGIAVAVALFFYDPGIIYCNNVLEAIALGGLSGLAATGCNQLFKQVSKFKGESTTDTTSDDESLV